MNREDKLLTGPEVGKQTMLQVDGKTFRCECGCNVFTEFEPQHYRCNGCQLEYTGEKE